MNFQYSELQYLVPRVYANPVWGVGVRIHAPADQLDGMTAEAFASLVLVHPGGIGLEVFVHCHGDGQGALNNEQHNFRT